MGKRNVVKEEVNRLGTKTLEARFLQIVQEGLNCSPFEAEAVLDVVREVYYPDLDQTPSHPLPGKITLVVVSAEEPAGKPLAQCEKRTVCLTLHRGAEDDRRLLREGPAAFRQSRIADLCQEALSQGGILTREDLAVRVFFVAPRTVTRDLKVLRETRPEVPLPVRGTVHDIGPVLSHRVEIIRLALRGKSLSEIARQLHHSPAAVANYWSTFVRCAQLAEPGMSAGQIAFLLRRGEGLIQRYLALWQESREEKNGAYHLQELLRMGWGGRGKKTPEGGAPMSRPVDYVRKKFSPLQQKNLQNAVAHRIQTEFPRIGGSRIVDPCAAMILEVGFAHLLPRERVRHGQVVWMAVRVDDPPARGKRMRDTQLIPVVLDLSTGEDVQRRLDREPPSRRLQSKAVRLCRQAYEQGALLSNCDLAELLNAQESQRAQLLVQAEREGGHLVPRRANVHDVGSGVTHKRVICWKHYREGKSANVIAV